MEQLGITSATQSAKSIGIEIPQNGSITSRKEEENVGSMPFKSPQNSKKIYFRRNKSKKTKTIEVGEEAVKIVDNIREKLQKELLDLIQAEQQKEAEREEAMKKVS